MPKRRLIRRLFLPYLVITIIAILTAVWFISRTVRSEYLDSNSRLLQKQTGLIGEYLISNGGGRSAAVDMAFTCRELGMLLALDIILIDTTGKIICSTDTDALYDFQISSPEVQAAFVRRGDKYHPRENENINISIRYSRPMHQDMIYAATSLELNELGGRIILRVSSSIEPVQAILRAIYIQITVIGIAVVLIVGLISWFVSKKLSNPFAEMAQVASRFAQGDLAARMPISGISEIDDFASVMNQMAVALQGKIEAIARQGQEREAILISMAEGVLAVDPDEKIIWLNPAAAEMIGCARDEAIGKVLQEIVRNVELQRFVSGTLQSAKSAEGELILYNKEDRFIQAHGVKLYNSEGGIIGALIVLNDITAIRKLENVRREFVSNVSHELRTPITSIKGFVETLQDGAVDNPEDARKFLGIISRQADRLHGIIDDLLSLSRIERDSEKQQIELKRGSVVEVLKNAIASCDIKARAKNIELSLIAKSDYSVPINSALLEQAVTNLLDNAIKYSQPGLAVEVNLRASNGEIVIAVADMGCGIEKSHLPRIFERFYRADNARSRNMGGTGLGLAIVKHIAIAQGGHVSVESEPGRGSIFRIHIPIA